MRISSFYDRRSEAISFSAIVILLGLNAAVNASFGFVLPIFLVTVIPSAILALFFPRVGLLSSVVLTIFFERFHTLVPMIIGDAEYKLYAIDVVLAVSFLSILLSWIRSGRMPRIGKPGMFLLVFFGIVTAIFLSGLFGSSEAGFATAFSTWKNYVFYGAIFFLVSEVIRTKEDFSLFAKVLLLAVGGAIFFFVVGIVRGGGLWAEYTPLSTPGIRFLAFPHAFYFSLAFLSLLFSAPYWFSDLKRKRIFLFLMVIFGVGILGSLMRHLWLGVGGAIVFGILFFSEAYRKTLLRMVISMIGVGGFMLLVFLSGLSLFPQSDVRRDVNHVSEVVSERLFSIGNRYDESLAWRERVWRSSLGRFSENPIFGVGFGASVPVELGGYESFVEVRNMHNSWLAMLIQTGIVGVGVFLWFLFTLFIGLFRSNFPDQLLDSIRHVLLGLIVFQCLIFFSQPYLETNLLGMFFWITLGLSWSMIRMRDERLNHP